MVFNANNYLDAIQLIPSALLALQGALHHWLAADASVGRESARCDNDHSTIINFVNFSDTDMT